MNYAKAPNVSTYHHDGDNDDEAHLYRNDGTSYACHVYTVYHSHDDSYLFGKTHGFGGEGSNLYLYKNQYHREAVQHFPEDEQGHLHLHEQVLQECPVTLQPEPVTDTKQRQVEVYSHLS